ncbi:hypothetical protein GCM10010423_00860 [Streptomyces levis]|uniref:Uncharacterized protein n=1 Tax=Streptomyces levis TaxID=285566 RepID=A0ABP6AFY4_9ACTN
MPGLSWRLRVWGRMGPGAGGRVRGPGQFACGGAVRGGTLASRWGPGPAALQEAVVRRVHMTVAAGAPAVAGAVAVKPNVALAPDGRGGSAPMSSSHRCP